jgi:hypothetical protein
MCPEMFFGPFVEFEVGYKRIGKSALQKIKEHFLWPLCCLLWYRTIRKISVSRIHAMCVDVISQWHACHQL